jgi:soluble lytic murein transglycosylase-like protein
MFRALFVGICLSGLLSAQAMAAADGPCEREMALAAERHGVPLAVLYAVALNETGRGGKLHAYALNVAGKAVYASSLAAAVRSFEEARASGHQLIDVGCMQINHYWHAQEFASVKQMFDPGTNVDYGAQFLRQIYRQEGSWARAVAIYHAGRRNHSAQSRYVCGVIGRLVESGMGAWTDRARAYCSAD